MLVTIMLNRVNKEGLVPSKRPTSADVAARAGVSRATVSYVLNNSPKQTIPQATQERVRAAAAELGYTPHAAAQALRRGESDLILMVVDDLPYGANMSDLVNNATHGIAAMGKSLMTWTRGQGQSLAQVIRHLQPCLVLSPMPLVAGEQEALDAARVPWVRPVFEMDALDLAQNPGAAQVTYLIQQGHRRIGFVNTTDARLRRVFAEPREAAAVATCAGAGHEPLRVTHLATAGEDELPLLGETLRAWHADGVTAVACYNDVYAGLVLRAARESGLSVPAELSVIGVDDEHMSAFLDPPLTTVTLDMAGFTEELMQRARVELHGGLEEIVPASPIRVVERESVSTR